MVTLNINETSTNMKIGCEYFCESMYKQATKILQFDDNNPHFLTSQ